LKKRPVRVQSSKPAPTVTVVPAPKPAAPRKRGRKLLIRNSKIPAIVRGMAAHGLTQEECAKIVGISEATLKARLGDEFKAGLENYDGAVVKNLRRHALGDNSHSVTAAIYWTKTRLGWSEKIRLEHTFGPVIERMVSSMLDLLHRAIPDFCPGCRTALNVKPEIARLMLSESEKLTGAAAAAAAEIPQAREGGA
jgi:predicted DNA-binding protein (UPF0251 family)